MKYASARACLLFLSILASWHCTNAMTKKFSKYTTTFYNKIKGDHVRALVTTNVGRSVRVAKRRFIKKRGFGPKGEAVLFDPELSKLSRAVYLCINHKKTKTGNWDISAKEQIYELPGSFHVSSVIPQKHPFGIIKSTTQPETSLD